MLQSGLMFLWRELCRISVINFLHIVIYIGRLDLLLHGIALDSKGKFFTGFMTYYRNV